MCSLATNFIRIDKNPVYCCSIYQAASVHRSAIMMTESHYKLFDGVDFGRFFFSSNVRTNGQSARPAETCGVHGNEGLPRPIVKSHDNSCTPTISTNTTSSANRHTTNTVVANRPEPQQGSSVRTGCARTRSTSCSSGGSDGAGGVQCVFCKRNGETREFFTTHVLKDWRGVIVCPVLRAYTCPKCGSTGDFAHTESHCPLSANQPSFMSSLRTRRSSCGTRLKYIHKSH